MSDERIDTIQTQVENLHKSHEEMKDSHNEMKAEIKKNKESLTKIEKQTEPLQDIATGIQGLRMLGKLIVWGGGIVAGLVAITNYIWKSGGN